MIRKTCSPWLILIHVLFYSESKVAACLSAMDHGVTHVNVKRVNVRRRRHEVEQKYPANVRHVNPLHIRPISRHRSANRCRFLHIIRLRVERQTSKFLERKQLNLFCNSERSAYPILKCDAHQKARNKSHASHSNQSNILRRSITYHFLLLSMWNRTCADFPPVYQWWQFRSLWYSSCLPWCLIRVGISRRILCTAYLKCCIIRITTPNLSKHSHFDIILIETSSIRSGFLCCTTMKFWDASWLFVQVWGTVETSNSGTAKTGKLQITAD